jgi:dipeptidyl aminopeptidase/acylaminoacyl peptidase
MKSALFVLALTASALLAAPPAEDLSKVYIQSYDGAYVAAAWRKPPGEGPFPAILFIHGGVGGSGPEAAANMLRGRVPEHFHRRGYATMATDYRRFHFGEDEIRDVVAAYKKLESYPFVDRNRIAVIGGSHGGYLTQMLITRVTPAAAVSFAGLTDIEAMFYETGLEMRRSVESWESWMEELLTHRERAREAPTPPRESRVSGANETEGRERLVPGANAPLRPGSAGYEVALELGWRHGERKDAFRTISPKEHVAKVKGPVLYLVGGQDRLRFAGKEWVEALRERGVTAEYSEHEGMPHGFYWGRGDDLPKQFHEALEVTTRFIEKHLKN